MDRVNNEGLRAFVIFSACATVQTLIEIDRYRASASRNRGTRTSSDDFSDAS